MKKLLIIRHAKAAHETEKGDFERPLKHSGEKDAAALGKKLKKADITPQIIYSSPALRAKTTANIISDELDLAKPEFVEGIYEASEKTLANMVTQISDQYDFAALTGHNPGLSYLITYLTGEYCNLHTCAAALLSFEIDAWGLISSNTGKIAWYYEPED